jgi:hypothetical protein
MTGCPPVVSRIGPASLDNNVIKERFNLSPQHFHLYGALGAAVNELVDV